MTDCPKQYRNHTEEAFNEGKYVTSEMLRQFCRNDSYLKGETDELWTEINPTSRKRLNPLPVDDSLSYGVTIPTDNDKTSRLSNSTSQSIYIDFTDDTLIDHNSTTASIESLILNNTSVKRASIPRKTTTTLYKDTRDYSPWAIPDGEGGYEDYSDLTCNEYWYISYDRSRNYETRPNWLKNHFNGEIPGVCRAQTFKANNSGKLEAVTLNLKGGFNTGVPLTVGIMQTETKDGVKYPRSTHDYSNGDPWLASQEVEFENIDPGVYSVTFENPCFVEEDSTYAICLFSNLTHPSTPYYVGGWSQSCEADIYDDGDAFLSENSGATWTRYGKPEEDVPYHYGNQAPQDFAFICHIRAFDGTKYYTGTNYYLYLKPIRCNPCNSITLVNPTGSGHDTSHTLEFQVTTTPSDENSWITFGNTGVISFTGTTKPTRIFCRVLLKTTTESTAPYLESFGLLLNTNAALTGYARLPYYYPPTECMLGANVWGGLYTPYLLDADTSITDADIELISNRTVNEHRIIINPIGIKDYTYLPELEDYATDISALADASACSTYLTNHSDVVSIFKGLKIHIIGFLGSISLDGTPAYPMISCTLNTTEENEDDEEVDVVKEYGEWYEYTTDYTGNTLTFNTGVTLTPGTLNIQYNPVIVEGLKMTDLPFRLDYMEETFTFDSDDVVNGEFTLKVCPNDPIKSVYYMGEELEEDIDYHIDYLNGVLILDNIHDNGGTLYSVGDTITITYTPCITENALSVGYNLTRTSTSYNINLGLDSDGKCSYIEYKS